MMERLQKIIGRAGITSRRRAEELIVAGQVEVNGQVVTALGTKADPEHDAIRVQGRRVKLPERELTLIVNKPDGCVCALVDPAGRPTLRESLAGVAGRVFPVGGLEYHATGLVVLTSDGALAARLFRALGQGLPQVYLIKVKAPLSPAQLQALARSYGALRPARSGPNPWYEARLSGAQLARLRTALHEMRHPVEKLKRIAIGRIELGDLETGRWRPLGEGELRSLGLDMERASSLPAAKPMEARHVPAASRPAWKRLGPPRRPRKAAPAAPRKPRNFGEVKKARRGGKPAFRRKRA